MPIRLIVIEDEPDDLEWIVGALADQERYEIRAPANLDELLQLLDHFNPHLVLCDHFLDDQQWAYTGVSLAAELGGQRPWVLMTKRPQGAVSMFGIWNPSNGPGSLIKHFYNKLDPIERLLEVIAETIDAHIPINDRLVIDSSVTSASVSSLADALIIAGRMTELQGLYDNVHDLLRMLFRSYDRIAVERTIHKRDGAYLLNIRAWLSQGEPDDLLLFCGWASVVNPVLDAFAAHRRPNGALGQYERRVRLNVAGAVFGFSDSLAHLHTLSELCFNRLPSQIRPILERLIIQQAAVSPLNGSLPEPGATVLAAIRSHLQLPQAITPHQAQAWLRVLTVTGSQLLSISYDTATRSLHLLERSGRLVSYPNPFDVLAELERLGEGWSAPCGPLYGAPQPDEILIDEQRGQPVLWNYQLFALYAPHLLFFAQLEARLVFEVLPYGDPLEYYELQLALLAEDGSSGQADLSPTMQLVYELLRSYRICVVRQLELADLRPYYVALLLCALRLLHSMPDKSGVRTRSIHALLAALVLAERLLGAIDAEEAQNGLYINLQTRRITIDGENVERTRGTITPRNREFLIFLYERAERIVSYEEIVCDFNKVATRTELEQMTQWERNSFIDKQKGGIEIMLNRLRKVVRAPGTVDGVTSRADKQRYLKTEKSVGVILIRRPSLDKG